MATSEAGTHTIKSPIAGELHLGPVGADWTYVYVGQVVKEGKKLASIEVMKMVSDIFADMPGRIVKVCAEDGHQVEPGQALFELQPE